MALIICNGCGKEISDKSIACINCGDLITRQKDIEDNFYKIQQYLEDFLFYKTVMTIMQGTLYNYIQPQVEFITKYAQLQTEEEKKEIFRRLALILIDFMCRSNGIMKDSFYEKIFSFVDFNMVPEDTITLLGENIYEILTETTDDSQDKKENKQHEVLWYPIYMVLKFGSSEIVRKLLECLKEVDSTGEERLEKVKVLLKNNLKTNLELDFYTGEVMNSDILCRLKYEKEILQEYEKKVEKEQKAQLYRLPLAVVCTYFAFLYCDEFIGIVLLIVGAVFGFMLVITHLDFPKNEIQMEKIKERIAKLEAEIPQRKH